MALRLPRILRRMLFPTLACSLLAAIAPPLAPRAAAQIDGGAATPPPESLVHVRAFPLTIAAGTPARAKLELTIAAGWHINANPPSPDYMIPTRVTVVPGFGLTPQPPAYPAPQKLKLGFDPNPLSVYTQQATIEVPLAGTQPVNGAHALRGKLTYQACNDQVCTPPVTIPFTVAVTVSGGVAESGAGAAPAESTAVASGSTPAGSAGAAPATGAGFATAPPVGGVALDNPVARALAGGGWRAWLTLLLVGLALNLTPCVYPMIGVTVSIFGAQKARSPFASFGMALVYVLGLATMYSTLGVIAALSGGLFGSALQSPLVSVGIGVLLIALALSMFGLYQLQPPAWVLARFGGVTATSLVGAFFSGMLVGIFAAPCVGPPVVALLAVVGAKGDPGFGFLSFFTLSMGLGLPYLVLGTFSGLLRRLPRSGEWMIWVERVFGVILLAVGLFYALLALAPGLAAWVAPAALILGGIYLGFIERSTGRWRGFPWLKRLAGAAAVILGAVLVTGLSRAGVTFEPYSPPAVEAALASGRPVLLDFSADWCIPCRELEHITLKDPRVLGESRRFRAFRVDLTRFDSAEAESLRTRWKIHGVPTIVFLTKDGHELPAARVEGFLKPALFLERMKTASSS